MLEVRDVQVRYGAKYALHRVSLEVGAREIVALVGHNGAGKTTLLRAALGLVATASGSIRFKAAPVQFGSVAATARLGLSFVPQGRHVFRDLTVAENLTIAHEAARGERRVGYDDVYELFPILRERLRHSAGSLSGGQQQMVALACALLRDPDLMMLDEPSTGLAPVLVDEVFAIVARLRERFGLAVLIVDQNVHRLLEIADRAYVLKAGEIVHHGPARELADTEKLWELF